MNQAKFPQHRSSEFCRKILSGRFTFMKIHTLLLVIMTVPLSGAAAPLHPWGSTNIPDSIGWVFDFEGTRYDSVITRDALLSTPSWSPEKPLPLSTANAVASARRQLASLVADPSKWSATEIQIMSANPSAETQRWYYAIHFLQTDRSQPNASREYIIVCVDFRGRAGAFKPKSQ